MNLNEIFSIPLFNIGSLVISVGSLVAFVLVWVLIYVNYIFIGKRWLPKYFKNEKVVEETQHKIMRLLRFCLLLLGVILSLASIPFDYLIFQHPRITIRLSSLLTVLLTFQTARLIDWIVSKVLITNYNEIIGQQKQRANHRYAQKEERTADQTVQYLVYVLAIMITIQLLQINFQFGDLFSSVDLPNTTTETPISDSASDGEVEQNERFISNFKLSTIFKALLILLAARLGVWILINLFLYNYYKRRRINIGSQYAINQLLKYFIYVIALLIALESIGVKLTVLWGGAAALLVGIGLGLQQTFNDLISGLILLFERTVEVGDFVEVDSLLGTVKRIGLRTSLVETRDNITVIVPNSKLIVDSVINWSHYDNKARFSIKVGVAYGSDTQLVKKILLDIAQENGHVIKYPSPFVRFTDFGSSSLDFELFFWSNDFNNIDNFCSDMRFEIDARFREANIEIPFPQRDVWIRTPKNTNPNS